MRKDVNRLIRKKIIIYSTLVMIILITSLFMPNTAQSESRVNEKVASEEWSEDVRLTYTSKPCEWPSIAVCNSIIHVVWTDNRDEEAHGEIYYKRSPDNGITWECDVRLTYSYELSEYPQIAVNGSNVHVVWADWRDGNREIYYKRSTNNGETWGGDIRLTELDGYTSCGPKIAVEGSNVYVSWEDGRDYGYPPPEVYFKTSNDNGENWTKDKRLTFTPDDSSAPYSIAVHNGKVDLIYGDRSTGAAEVYHMYSLDNGGNWSNPVMISVDDGSDSFNAKMAVEEDSIHIVWVEIKENWNYEIYYRSSTDGGESWGSIQRLTNDPAYSDGPTIAINDSNVHIVWMDERDDPAGNNSIYYKYITNGGLSWSDDIKLTGPPIGNAYQPKIVANNEYLHIIWFDTRDLDYEIYYKRSPDFNHPPTINYRYPLENLIITENQNITFMANASDPDNDILSYQWHLNNESVGGNQSSYTFNANSTCSGTFTIRVVVSDGELTVNHTWELTVINVGELYDSIADLQDQVNLLNLLNVELNETISSLTQNIIIIWDELNQSVQNYSYLQNQTIALMDTLSAIWDLLNQSKMNESVLQNIIDELNQNLNISNEQISIFWNLLNQSKQNETTLLSQINELQQENTKLKEELNKTKNKETPWIGVGETVIIILLVCIMVLVYRKKKIGGGRLV